MHSELVPLAKNKQMKSIIFFNNKGGVGKTTTVYHVAWMLSELGIKTIAVDLDPQSNLTSCLLYTSIQQITLHLLCVYSFSDGLS